jgi:hypothetical protein
MPGCRGASQLRGIPLLKHGSTYFRMVCMLLSPENKQAGKTKL